MKKLLSFILLLLPLVAYTKAENSQTKSHKEKPIISLSATLESMHQWRGNASSDMPTITSRMELLWGNKRQLNIGVWGASAMGKEVSGVHYKEIDYFLVYRQGNFSIGLWDQFGMKGIDQPNIFDYNSQTTQHYVDLEMTYFFGKKIPLHLQADIAIYGNDYEQKKDGALQRRYSTYIEGAYDITLSPQTSISPFVGIGTALNGRTMNYGNGNNNFDLVNLGIITTQQIAIKKWYLPVQGRVFWNPAQKIARLQISLKLF